MADPMIAERLACSKCGKAKPSSGFRPDARRPNSLRQPCRECERQRVKEYYRTHPDRKKLSQKEWRRKQRGLYPYKLTLERFDQILERQNGCCAICGTDTPTASRSRFSIDHCHETGIVRGLLCHPCNSGLGMFKDRPDLLLAAVSYLRRPPGSQ